MLNAIVDINAITQLFLQKSMSRTLVKWVESTWKSVLSAINCMLNPTDV